MTQINNQTPPKATEPTPEVLSKKERQEAARKVEEAQKAEQRREALEESYVGTGFVMAKDRALTSLRGILADGEPVGTLDFAEGIFDLWKGRGWIVKDPKGPKGARKTDEGAES